MNRIRYTVKKKRENTILYDKANEQKDQNKIYQRNVVHVCVFRVS